MKQKCIFAMTLVQLLIFAGSVQAQSLKDLFNKENIDKVVNAISGKASKVEMCGTWDYTGTACEFESEDFLKKAGGSLAATAVERELNQQCSKIGITSGKFSFTFNSDSTFVNTYGKKQYKGTYSYDATTQKVHLKYGLLLNFNVKTEVNANSMNLLFNADKLLKLLTFFGSKSNSTIIKTASQLGDEYDGMLLGFALSKKS